MADVVNLRTLRKRAKRQQDDRHADANRPAHGRSKSAKALSAAQQAKADRNLDQHRIETGDGR
jgi:hypothetical protein